MAEPWSSPRTPEQWLESARVVFEDFLQALDRHGVRPDPRLRLVAGDSLYPYYEQTKMTIGIGMPDPKTILGRLYWLFAARVLGVESVEDAVATTGPQLPFLVSHEVTHHLRHHYGVPTENDFVEEQVANVVALSFVGEHPVYRGTIAALREVSTRAAAKLADLSPETGEYLPGFRLELGEVLVASGGLTRERLDEARALARATGRSLDETLDRMGLAEVDLGAADRRRRESEAYFNRRYMASLAEYARFFNGWFLSYLERAEQPTLGEALEAHVLTGDWERARRAETLALLVAALGHPADEVAAAAAEAVAEEAGPEGVAPLLAAAAAERPAVTVAALAALARIAPSDPRAVDRAESLLDCPHVEVAAAAAGVILAADAGRAGRARELLLRLVEGGEAGRRAALEVIARSGEPSFGALLAGRSQVGPPAECEIALRGLARVPAEPRLAEVAAAALDDADDGVRVAAAACLRRHASERTAQTLVSALGDTVEGVREEAAGALRELGEPAAAALRGARGDWHARAQAALVLHGIARAEGAQAIRGLISELSTWSSRLASVRAQLDCGDPTVELLGGAVGEELRKLARLGLRLASPLGDERAANLALAAIASSSDAARRAAADVLGRAVAPELRPELEPLLSHLAGAGGLLTEGVACELECLHDYPGEFLRWLAGDVLGNGDAAPGTKSPDEGSEMLTTVEKLMFLRSVPIFEGVALEDLRALAESFLIERYRLGETIFERGEDPTALFLLAAGRLELERDRPDGEPVRIGEVAPRELLGAEAVFSGRAHPFSARVTRDATVLALQREHFLRMGVRNPQILVHVLGRLSERLLELTSGEEGGGRRRAAPDAPARQPGLSYVWAIPAVLRSDGL